MQDFDDILNTFTSNETTTVPETKTEEPKKTYNNYNNNNSNQGGYKQPYNGNKSFNKDKTPSVWETTVFPPLKVNVEGAKTVKAFTVFTHGREDIELPKLEQIVKVASALIKKGFIFRCIGDTRDVVSTEICKIPGAKIEFYLPIRKFNEDVTDFVTKLPSAKACNIAANYHNLYNMNTKANIQLSPIERMKHGSRIHVMLGKECDEHIELMLLVSNASQTTKIKKDNKIDFKSYGNILFPIDVAEDTNIKVMNVNEKEFSEKFMTYYKDLKDLTEE